MPARDIRRSQSVGVGELAHPRNAGRWTALMAVAAALVAMIALASSGHGQTPVGSPAASPVTSPVASPVAAAWTPTTQMIVAGHATIVVTDDSMTPAHFESAVGRDVRLTVANAGTRTHNFTMEAFGIDVDLAPGESATFEIDGPALGTYRYFSDLPGDEDLRGTMTVFI